MILAIVGPTGVGKTKLSIELAKKYNAIIINCDAIQVYDELNIGTAKIEESEKQGIPHFLFNIKKPNEDYSIYEYQKDARDILKKYKNQNIIFVGGSGLYLKSALYDYDLSSEEEKKDYSSYTNEELYKLALKKDPNHNIHPNNRLRLERFLSRNQTTNNKNIKKYDHLIIGLTTDRENLYNIINNRVDQMIEKGLIKEVEELYKKYGNVNSLNKAIGYKELIPYLENKKSLSEAILEIKKNSRHYAKRQYTFFNNQFKMNWFNVDFKNFSNTIDEVINFINN